MNLSARWRHYCWRLSKITALFSVLTATLFSATTLINTAHAARHRDLCYVDDAGIDGRKLGVRNAKKLFERMWEKNLRKKCSKLDKLIEIISNTNFKREGKGVFSACFYQGYVETLYDKLGDAALACEETCFAAGEEIGYISAQGYCAASMALDGLDDPGFIRQPPLKICEANASLGCQTKYIETASFDFEGCQPFTEGDFERVFENSIRQDCFIPEDEELDLTAGSQL